MTIGLGASSATFCVYIEHPPKIEPYNRMTNVAPIQTNEIQYIGQECGNGWRKIFNVYAKLIFEWQQQALIRDEINSWQVLRDKKLLQLGDNNALLFSPPKLGDAKTIHVIAGRNYAKKLLVKGLLSAELTWLNDEFAIDKQHRLIVCPFFDYRQLSNSKITFLISLLKTF